MTLGEDEGRTSRRLLFMYSVENCSCRKRFWESREGGACVE